MTPSQLAHFIGMDAGFDYVLFKSISTAYSVSAQKEAMSLLKMCAEKGLEVKRLARIPNAEDRFRLGIVTGDFCMHPYLDLYSGAIHEFLDNEKVELVLLLFGFVDRTYSTVADLLKKAGSKGRVVEMGEVNASNQAEVFKKARDLELHACVDCLGSAHGSERVRAIIAARLALMQAHHLNSPFLQHPVSGWGNDFMVADPVMFPPQGNQTRLLSMDGTESMFKVSCWMNPLRPDGFDMTATRESFGLDPDKLYLVFPALNSKLDPAAIELWASVLARTADDVLLWFISYPKLGAMNIVDSLKKSRFWNEETHAQRVVIGKHLPQDRHKARLAAFANGGRGAIFLNVCFTYPGHTTGQEGVCAGLLVISLITSKAGSIQRAAATFMHQLGLDDCVANDEDGVLALVQYWCHQDRDQIRKKLRDDLRHEFVTQTGPFFDQRRIPSEILHGFRTIAKNSLELSPDGLRLSNKPVDARLDQFSPSLSRVSCNTACKPLIPCEPSSQLTLIMKGVAALKMFKEEQMPMVFSILCLALENGIYPDRVIGTGGFTVAIGCLTRSLEEGVLSLEHHPVFVKNKDKNLHNSEIARGAYAELELKTRIGRSFSVRAVENPLRTGAFSCAFGHTRPVGDKGEVVVFRYRALLRNQLRHFFQVEFDFFRKTGELRDSVRLVQQAVHVALGQLNDEAKISHLDVSPANLFIEGSPEDDQIYVLLPDLGGAGVHAQSGQTSCHANHMFRRHSTAANPGKHDKESKKKAKNTSENTVSTGSRKQTDSTFQFWGWGKSKAIFDQRAEKGGILKSIRKGTPPFWNTDVNGEMLTPALGQHIDLFAVVRMLLWKLAPILRDEKIEDWDSLARAAAVSTDAMGAFIASRLPANLQEGHPRQPLMWKRLLDYLVNGLQPWSSPEPGQDSKLTLSKMATCLFLTMPFLAAADDRLLAGGGSIEAPGGDLYGNGIPPSLKCKPIPKVLIRLITGKGVGTVAAHQLKPGTLVGIYLSSRKPKLENSVESRFSISILGEDYTFVARFTPEMNFRWHIDKKKSTGPFFNAPGPGEKANCTLERSNHWDDDRDKDFGQFLKIIAITVGSKTIEEGEELTLDYNPDASRNRNFPVSF
jgi:predicted O-linked N-acetylglucosamine transferase (SPINDLY family)